MGIQHIRNTRSLEALEKWGPVGIPMSQPACELRGVKKSIPGKEGTETGVWECSPGRYRREIKPGEVMHILAGECIFTPDGGEAIEIRAGDTLFMSPNTMGVWDIRSTVRKVYVLI